jgi:hypothetical protein
MTYKFFATLLVAALLALGTARANAHFLFIRITPPAEGGRAAEVYFSERAAAGDPRFIAKVAHTSLKAQMAPGEFKPLAVTKAADRLRAHLPSQGVLAVSGFCEYGVLARAGETPFLLRYYPKALAGTPDELNRLKADGDAAFEIVPKLRRDDVELVALAGGRPLPRAQFHIVDSSLAEEELLADDDGHATWKPSAVGAYSIYVKRVLGKSGEQDGKHFDEIREFATLWLTWQPTPAAADPQAVKLFEDAVAARATWRRFPGFRAKITGSIDDRGFEGHVTLRADGSAELTSDDDATVSWVEEQLGSIAMHRAEATRASGESPARLWFGDPDDADHPLGRLLIFEGGRFASSYRVKDRQITVVNRALGDENMTITVLDNEVNAEGQFLPRGYIAHYWDETMGRLLRSEAVKERWRRVGDFDLPVEHTVVRSSDAGQPVRSFTLSEHELLR